MDKILSVIIPTYNMEKYLSYCLDSLLIVNNFEALDVLVINDGSKDASLLIAKQYEERYPNIFRVIDKENGNYGSCINRGLKEAKGKYVKILDADDSYDTVNFESFVTYLLSIDADLILSDYVIVDENREIISSHQYKFPIDKKLKFDEISSSTSFKSMQMHAVTYRRQNLLEINYTQTEGISYTDQQWIFIPMLMVKTIYHFDKPVYRYLVGREGQTMDPSVQEKYATHLKQCIWGMLDSYNQYRKQMVLSQLEYFHARLRLLIRDIYINSFYNYDISKRDELIQFDKELEYMSKYVYTMIEKKGFDILKIWRKDKNVNILAIRMLIKIYVGLLWLKRNKFNIEIN